MAERALSEEQRALLERWAGAQKTPQSVALRARIVLLAAAGESNSQIARALAVSRPTVILWRSRFAEGGAQALTETKPGRGRKPTISAAKIKAIVQATTQTTPPGQTHWSCRSMAKAQGVSAATVQRIWDAHGLKPHRVRTFKLSNDPRFSEKLTDVVGLYLNRIESTFGAIDEFVCKNADYLDWDAFGHALADHVRYRNRPAERERRKIEAARRRQRRAAKTTTQLKLAA